MNDLIKTELTMSSVEIAELTGKRHDNVMSDIKRILKEAQIDSLQFKEVYLNAQNQTVKVYNLPKRECDLVISGYSVKYRLAIIDRWHELEAKQSIAMPNFNDPAEAAIAWANEYRAKQRAIATKAEIGARREATAMNTASQATKKASKLEIELDKAKEYCTIKRMEMLKHGQKFNWILLKSTGIEMAMSAIDIFDANYGTVKAYHSEVWKETYGLEF